MLKVITAIFLSHRILADYTILNRGRIVGDGNCFFRALAVLITGSQEDHVELRALITTYLSHNADQFSSYLKEHESIIQYLKISKMDTLTVWATEIEIFAAAQMLQTSIYVYAISGGKYTWLCYNPSGQYTRDAARLGRTTTDNCIKDPINRACVYTYIINIDQSLKATYNWPMQ